MTWYALTPEHTALARASATRPSVVFQSEGKEHDAGDHWQVQVAVGVQLEPVELETGGSMGRLRAKMACADE